MFNAEYHQLTYFMYTNSASTLLSTILHVMESALSGVYHATLLSYI